MAAASYACDDIRAEHRRWQQAATAPAGRGSLNLANPRKNSQAKGKQPAEMCGEHSSGLFHVMGLAMTRPMPRFPADLVVEETGRLIGRAPVAQRSLGSCWLIRNHRRNASCCSGMQTTRSGVESGPCA